MALKFILFLVFVFGISFLSSLALKGGLLWHRLSVSFIPWTSVVTVR